MSALGPLHRVPCGRPRSVWGANSLTDTGKIFFDRPLPGLYRKCGIFRPMQIPATSLKFLAGFLTQPQAGSGQQIDSTLQVKANAQTVATRVRPAARGAPGQLSQLGSAQTLDDAVRTLRAEGRLPPRGSLLDIRA